MSCHGNQKKYIVGKEDKFKRFLKSELERETEFIIHKEAGIFIFVADRKGHDKRYAIDPTKTNEQLNWRAANYYLRRYGK